MVSCGLGSRSPLVFSFEPRPPRCGSSTSRVVRLLTIPGIRPRRSRAPRDLIGRPQLLKPLGRLVDEPTRSELARLGPLRLLPGSLVCVPGRVTLPGAFAATSRVTTDGTRPIRRAIELSDSSARMPMTISSRSVMLEQPGRGSHSSGTPVVTRLSRTMSPTIGAVQPISRAMSTSLHPRWCNRNASCFCSCVENPGHDAPVIERLRCPQDRCARRWNPPKNLCDIWVFGWMSGRTPVRYEGVRETA
jgi:hypothetical protein